MKKILSLFLALWLLFSVAGCGTLPEIPETIPATVSETQPLPQIIVPDLTGQALDQLSGSEEYTVSVSHEMTAAGYFNGQIISQAPVAGSKADFGSVIYVIVNVGGPEQENMTEPEVTQPEITQPSYTIPVVTESQETRPDLPEQTDPPRPSADPPQEQVEQTDPPETLPPQTNPPQTEPPETEPPQTNPPQTEPPETEPPTQYLDPNGTYTSKEDVALYIHLYRRLPNNFVTKNQAEDLYGWTGGSLSRYGMCIGGDRFYNNEGRLPNDIYYECDIDTLYSSKRGAKRLVFTYSGIVYYTANHYHSFQRLY